MGRSVYLARVPEFAQPEEVLFHCQDYDAVLISTHVEQIDALLMKISEESLCLPRDGRERDTDALEHVAVYRIALLSRLVQKPPSAD